MNYQLPPPTTDHAVPTAVTADHAVPTAVTADHAVPGADQPEPVAGTSTQFRTAPREPLNRRGRRYLSAAIGRSQRRIFRSIARQELAERAARTNARF